MAIRVTTNATAASIASVKPRVSVVVSSPVVAASASVPAAQIDYIELVVSAGLDTTGRFRFIQEIAVVSDAVSLLVAKAAQDSVALSDVSALEVGKGLADSVSFSEEVLRTLIFIRSFNDSFAVGDAASLSVSRPLNDALLMSDANVRQFTKVLTEVFAVADSTTVATTKPVADLVEVLEALVRSSSKVLTDGAATSDAVAASVDKALSDAFGVADQQTVALAKSLADGVGINDSAEATDGLLVQFTKSFANVAFATDAMVRAVSAGKTDSVAFAESGSVVNQGYCDLTYFAEDYVGDSRTFS